MQSEATGNYPVASCSAHERYLVDAPLRGCLVCRSSFFHVVKMTVPNSALPVFTAKNCPGQAKAIFRAIRNVFSAKQLPEGIFWLRSFSRQMGIFQLARKVPAMVGSRAPKPSAASAGYRHETA